MAETNHLIFAFTVGVLIGGSVVWAMAVRAIKRDQGG